jgi:hypothetical protein
MNGLILSIFGDGYISLECEGGECLHFSQVPGYVVRFFSSLSFLRLARGLISFMADGVETA